MPVKENEYGTAERQNILLDMMKDIHAYCEKESIKYSLCGGTMLGAVRHKGFIPWDDDVDILLDRNNYNKFVENFKNCQGYKLERDLWIMRVRRESDISADDATIDLFIADNVPNGKFARKWKETRIKLLQGMMKKKSDNQKVSFFYRTCLFFTRILGKFFTYNYKWKKYNKISQKGNNKETEYVSIYNDLFKYIGIKYNKKLVSDFTLMPFEDAEFYVSSDYHNTLTLLYGDYMTPPKKEERIPLHLGSKPKE